MDDPSLVRRLVKIEEQLAILSERAGVPYERQGAVLPPSVRELATTGRKIQAIQELRNLTGMSLVEAKEMVDDVLAGHGSVLRRDPVVNHRTRAPFT